MILTKFEKNRENPFLKQALEQVNSNIIKKYKTASKTGESAILQAFDKKTGEILGHTQFVRQIEVDEEKFAKIYLSNFSSFFDLKPQGIRVFGYILDVLIPNKDYFYFDRVDCLEYTQYKSEKSIYIGLASLLSSEIIARGKNDNHFFINPLIMFNGNRVTFAQTYVKKPSKNIPEINPNQAFIDFDETGATSVKTYAQKNEETNNISEK